MTRITRHSLALAFALFALLVAGPPGKPAHAQAQVPQAAPAQPQTQVAPPATDAVPGIRNYARVEPTLACGGALTADAYPALKQAGFASVVNMRAATEPGVNVEESKKAAEDAGLKYYHLPFVTATPDASKLDEFLKLVAAKENQPMMLHCASGGRASLFLFVKRVLLDGWTIEKASAELPERFNSLQQPVRDFALEYIKSHGKGRP